ncbi:ThiF family adenylyltransferase [Streptococcus danieliae]|uniref:ThiF family adenylyltransferase n=1 Tax=Streptococcus danieliae TaxID=747656 RepID=A0A7Z0LEA7_9STRE|nr:ThiF family adenylyltransferase [Streptococcus danieliae]NYS49772.1 ThiF family adenylyltransferase [Streptococcus danieliae]
MDKKIQTEDDVLDLIDGADLVISAIDEPRIKIQRIVNRAIVQAGIPCVFGGNQVSRGRVYSVIPGKSGCFDCLNIEYTKRDPNFVKQFVGHQKSGFQPPTIAYGPAMFQLTGVIADEAVRILTSYTEARSINCQFEIDYEKGASFRHQPWSRYPEDCPTCGIGNENHWEVFSYYGLR